MPIPARPGSASFTIDGDMLHLRTVCQVRRQNDARAVDMRRAPSSTSTETKCIGGHAFSRGTSLDPHRLTRDRPAEHDFVGGGGQKLIDALAAPSQLVQLTEHQGADGHCGGLGQEIWSEVVYRWLRDTFLHNPTTVTGKEKEHDH
jgi:hypothetical protein